MTQQLSFFLYIPHWHAPAKWSEPKPDFQLKSGLVVRSPPHARYMHAHTHGYARDAWTLKIAAQWFNLDTLPGLTGFWWGNSTSGDSVAAATVSKQPWSRAEAATGAWARCGFGWCGASILFYQGSTQAPNGQTWTQTCLFTMYQLLLQYFTQGSLVFWRQQTQIQRSPRKTGVALSQYKLFTANSRARIKETARTEEEAHIDSVTGQGGQTTECTWIPEWQGRGEVKEKEKRPN